METRCRVGWTSQRLSPISAVDCEVFVIVVPLLSLIFPYFYEGVAFSCLFLACFPNCSFSLLPAKGIIHVLSKTWYRIFRPTLNGKARRKRKKTAATPLRCFSCIAHVPKWNKKKHTTNCQNAFSPAIGCIFQAFCQLVRLSFGVL